MIEVLFVATILLAVPNGIAVATGRDARVQLAVVATGLLVAASFAAPAGAIAGMLALPWALVAIVSAVGRLPGFARSALARRGVGDRIGTDAAFAFLAVGASTLLASRVGLRPLGFAEPIVLLTAVHFHVAGFLLTLSAALLAGAHRRWQGTVAVSALLVGIPTTAVGFLGVPVLSFIGGWLVAGAGFLVGAGLVVVATDHEGLDRWLARVAGGALLVSMPLAAGWATTAFLGLPFLPIPLMAATHGTLNVVGFAIPAALFWRRTGSTASIGRFLPSAA